MIDVVAKRIWFLGFSLVIFVIGIISLAIPPNLNLGIDFLSGTGITVSFEKEINTEEIQSEFNSLGLSSTNTQSLGNDTFFIRTERLSDFSNSDDTSNVSREDVENSLKKIDDQYKILEVETVGSKVAEGTIRNSIVAVPFLLYL